MHKILLTFFCVLLCCNFSGVDETPLRDFMTCRINGNLYTTQWCSLYHDYSTQYSVTGYLHSQSDSTVTIHLDVDTLESWTYSIFNGMASIITGRTDYHVAIRDTANFLKISVDTTNDTIIMKGNFAFITGYKSSSFKITNGFFFFRRFMQSNYGLK